MMDLLKQNREEKGSNNQQSIAQKDLVNTLQDEFDELIVGNVEEFNTFLSSPIDSLSKKNILMNLILSDPKNAKSFIDPLAEILPVFFNSTVFSHEDKKEIIFSVFESDPKSAIQLIAAFPTNAFSLFLKSNLKNDLKKEILNKGFEINYNFANDFLSSFHLPILMWSPLGTDDIKDLLFGAYEKLQEAAKTSNLTFDDPLLDWDENMPFTIEFIQYLINSPDIPEHDKQLLKELLSVFQGPQSLKYLYESSEKDEDKKKILLGVATYFKYP